MNHLSEAELVALASGDADAAARAHVRDCLPCTARHAALERDLRMLRQVLVDEPLPAALPRRRAPVGWLPVATALAASALLAFGWSAWRGAPAAAPVQVAQVSSLARDVSAALFADAQFAAATTASDDADLQAALNGGWACDSLYCAGDDLLAYDRY